MCNSLANPSSNLVTYSPEEKQNSVSSIGFGVRPKDRQEGKEPLGGK